MKGKSIAAVLDGAFALADAQLVLAREYGFESWAKLKERVERGKKIEKVKAHPRFGEALEALRAGDIDRLRGVIGEAPELVKARTNLQPPYGYFSGATLLNHVAGNPGWERPLPKNIVEVARLLLEMGADPEAMTMGPNRGTTMGLVVTSKQASDSNVSGPLMDLLLEYGAKLDLKGKPDHVVPDWERMNVLDLPLANYAYRAAEKMIELGAEVDVCAAAALGRMDWLADCFDQDGELKKRPRRGGKLMSARDAIGLAMLFAYVSRRKEAVDFLLEKDGNWDMTGVNNGAAMHRAAYEGDLEMVKRLVAKGADIYNRDNPFNSTPLSWAQHNKQQAVFDWMRANCKIDLYEAVGFDLREHVEARLREDPKSVNRRLDHWDIPQCVPLHWAAWTSVEDVDGTHYFEVSRKKKLVEMLLESGADVNVVAGNGMTPVDIADAAKAPEIVEILRRNGGKRAREL
jgi:hypothetical protein